MSAPTTSGDDIVYPESDAKAMADRRQQARVIRRLVAGFERVFAGRHEFVVGGDFFWYPIEGDPKIVAAPDVTILFGVDKDDDLGNYRPRVYRGSIALAFEVMSTTKTWRETTEKRMFYDRSSGSESWASIRKRPSSKRGGGPKTAVSSTSPIRQAAMSAHSATFA